MRRAKDGEAHKENCANSGKAGGSRTASLDYGALVAAIGQAHQTAQRHAVQAINVALILRNWLIGYHIFEYEQHGSDRAEYGERLLEHLTQDLRQRLGRGFGRRSLEMSRQFYLRYPIAQSVLAQLGLTSAYASSVPFTLLDWQDDAYFARLFRELPWTHFIELIRIDAPLKRAFYEVEALKNRWSVRELKRQLDSLLYERVGLSRDQAGVLTLAKEGELITTPAEMVRDPYVFEVRHDNRGGIADAVSRTLGRRCLSRPTYLKPKGDREHRLLVKRQVTTKCPDHAPQGLRSTVKATLLELQLHRTSGSPVGRAFDDDAGRSGRSTRARPDSQRPG
jgi:hypothetical protein